MEKQDKIYKDPKQLVIEIIFNVEDNLKSYFEGQENNIPTAKEDIMLELLTRNVLDSVISLEEVLSSELIEDLSNEWIESCKRSIRLGIAQAEKIISDNS